MTDIQSQIDRFIADLQSRGFDETVIAYELTTAIAALQFNIPVEIARSGDDAAIERAVTKSIVMGN